MRQQPPPNPVGWYVVAFSEELAPGAVLTRAFAGSEIVIFRTASGEIGVTDPFCPHLGAHLGHGGTVVGEALQCPFHHFRFATSGACVRAYPGNKVPPTCKLPVREVRERNGHILVWHHPHGIEPDWEIPELDWEGWTATRWTSWHFRGHPQETSENSVDSGHFGVVHEYDAVKTLVPASVDGTLLHAKYQMHRAARGLAPAVTSDFEVFVHGLGYSVVEVDVLERGFHMRTFVLPQPAEDGHIFLRLGVAIRKPERKGDLHPLAALVPDFALYPIMLRWALATYTSDVAQDLEVWKNKTWLDRPRLAAGDGPIGLYRRYCRQFYPDSQPPLQLVGETG